MSWNDGEARARPSAPEARAPESPLRGPAGTEPALSARLSAALGSVVGSGVATWQGSRLRSTLSGYGLSSGQPAARVHWLVSKDPFVAGP